MFNRRYRSARIALADSCDPSQFPLELSLNCAPSPCHGRKILPSKRLPFTRLHPVPIPAAAAAATQLVLSRRLDLRRSNLPGASLASRRRSSTKWPSFGAVPKRVNSSRRKRPPTKKGQPMLIRYNNRLVTFPLQLFPSFNEIIGSRRVDRKGSSRSSCWKCPKPNVKICARSNETRRKSGRGATPVPTKRNRHRRSCPGYSDRGGAADDFERRRHHQQLLRRLRQRAGRHRRLFGRNPFPFRDPLSATKKRMTKKRWRSIGGSLISQRTPTLLRRVDRLLRRRAAWSRNGQKRISMQCERRWLRPRPAGWKNV